MNKIKINRSFVLMLVVLLMAPVASFGMHIMEGFLPIKWSIIWTLIFLPFFALGLRSLRKIFKEAPEKKVLIALVGAFVFILSALKIPSVTGSCSHPTGVGLGAIMFGPTVMAVVGTIALVFQAALLAHGGFTTLGANAFSMAVVGPFVSFGIYKLLRHFKVHRGWAVFLAAAIGDLATYVVTSLQLGLAFPDATGGFTASAIKFLGVFVMTQVPIAIGEGLLTTVVFNLIHQHEKEEVNVHEA